MGRVFLHEIAAIGLLLMAAAAPAGAQQAATTCQSENGALPPELALWHSRVPIETAPTTHAVPLILFGHAVDATLHPFDTLHYALAPNKPDAPDEYGGMVRFEVTEAATYRVALGSGAWIDVIAGGTSIASAAHARGPDCTGIRKMVDFVLKPGSYLLQLSAGRSAVIPVMIARLP